MKTHVGLACLTLISVRAVNSHWRGKKADGSPGSLSLRFAGEDLATRIPVSSNRVSYGRFIPWYSGWRHRTSFLWANVDNAYAEGRGQPENCCAWCGDGVLEEGSCLPAATLRLLLFFLRLSPQCAGWQRTSHLYVWATKRNLNRNTKSREPLLTGKNQNEKNPTCLCLHLTVSK